MVAARLDFVETIHLLIMRIFMLRSIWFAAVLWFCLALPPRGSAADTVGQRVMVHSEMGRFAIRCSAPYRPTTIRAIPAQGLLNGYGLIGRLLETQTPVLAQKLVYRDAATARGAFRHIAYDTPRGFTRIPPTMAEQLGMVGWEFVARAENGGHSVYTRVLLDKETVFVLSAEAPLHVEPTTTQAIYNFFDTLTLDPPKP